MENQNRALIVDHTQAPQFALPEIAPGLAVTGHASPSAGASETSVWRLTLAPGTPGGDPHSVTREEIFVCLSGRAVVQLDAGERILAAGDTLILPPDTQFSLGNPYREPFEAMVVFPIGGQAKTVHGMMTPPWAA